MERSSHNPGNRLGRRVGLNKNQRPQRLLSQIGGRPVKSLEVLKPLAPLKMSGVNKGEEYDPITALPESSDDEEVKKPAVGLKRDFIDDSDDDEPIRGDIVPTKFGKENWPPSSQASSTRKSTRNTTKPLRRESDPASSSQLEEPSSSAGSKRSREEYGNRAGSHLVNEYGFIGGAKKPKKNNSNNTSRIRAPGRHLAKVQGYGKSSQRLSQKSAPRSSAPQRDATTPPRTFKDYSDDGESPEQKINPLKSGFKAPSSVESTPYGTPQKPKLRQHSITSNDSPQKGDIKLWDSDEPELKAGAASPDNKRTSKLRTSTRSRSNTKTRKRESSLDDGLSAFSQKPVFKLPGDIDDLTQSVDYDVNHPIKLESDPYNDDDDDLDILATQAPREARCPMCHELVDPELLEKHSDRGRMNIRKQTAFCRMHKRRAALNSGTERGYPKIDWGTIESRLANHESFLREILEGSRPSHYASLLKEKIESGKNRTLLKTDESVTPGYYGPKGLRVMTDFIMRRLSSVIRKRAVEDRLISARSYTGYVQAVLMPELAVRLVMEDMDVNEAEARDILRDSIEVGELLHEETGDVVAHASEDEDI